MTPQRTNIVTRRGMATTAKILHPGHPGPIWKWVVEIEPVLAHWVEGEISDLNRSLSLNDAGQFTDYVGRYSRWLIAIAYVALRDGQAGAWEKTTRRQRRLLELDNERPGPAGPSQALSSEDWVVDHTLLDEAVDCFPPGIGHRLRELAESERYLGAWLERELCDFISLNIAGNGATEDVIAEVSDRIERVLAVAMEALRRGHYRLWEGTEVGEKLRKLDPGLAKRARSGVES